MTFIFCHSGMYFSWNPVFSPYHDSDSCQKLAGMAEGVTWGNDKGVLKGLLLSQGSLHSNTTIVCRGQEVQSQL